MRARVNDVVAANIAQQPDVIAQQHGGCRFGFRPAQIDQVHAGRCDRRNLGRYRRSEDQHVVPAIAGRQMRPQLFEVEAVAGEIGPEARKEMKHAHGASHDPSNDATRPSNVPRSLTGGEYALSSGKSAHFAPPLVEAVLITFDTSPERYRHWKFAVDGPVATLALDVAEDGGLVPGYKLK